MKNEVNTRKAIFEYCIGGNREAVIRNNNIDTEMFIYGLYNLKPKISFSCINGDKATIYIYVVSDRVESLVIEGDHKLFKEALKAVIDDSFDVEFIRYLFLKTSRKASISNYIGDSGISIQDGDIYYKGNKMAGRLANTISKAIKNKQRVKFLVNFLDKLMQNPSYHIHTRLFDFLEHNDIEITENGDFIAYKNVRDNFSDIYTGKFDNSPGKTVSMERNLVDDNDDNTCSAGLHACAKSYLKHYSGNFGKTVKVLINPKNVVSCPTDYDNAKIRTCEYYVMEQTSKNGE